MAAIRAAVRAKDDLNRIRPRIDTLATQSCGEPVSIARWSITKAENADGPAHAVRGRSCGTAPAFGRCPDRQIPKRREAATVEFGDEFLHFPKIDPAIARGSRVGQVPASAA